MRTNVRAREIVSPRDVPREVILVVLVRSPALGDTTTTTARMNAFPTRIPVCVPQVERRVPQ